MRLLAVASAMNLVSFAAGLLIARWWFLRHVRVREYQGHSTLEFHHTPPHIRHIRSTTTRENPVALSPKERAQLRTRTLMAVIMVVAALFIVAIGVQFYVARENDKEGRARDNAQIRCIENLRRQLATVYDSRSDASVKLERAQARKDDASDRVFLTVLKSRKRTGVGSEGLDAALQNFAEARRNLIRVQAEVDRVRAQNPPPNPNVTCTR